jgi:lysophospholipase L1-like esterase
VASYTLDQYEGDVVRSKTNPFTGVLGFSGPGGSMPIGSHISAVAIGDSLTARARYASTISSASALGPWNWANWRLGAPIVFRQNFGISGDTTRSIMSRIAAIPASIQLVFVITGTNDVISMSSSANQATIDSTFANVSSYIRDGLTAMAAKGKKVVISTIPPNNGLSSAGDSRIQLLDRLNAYIATLASSSVFVVDGFTAMWDATQPTLRLAKPNTMHTDNTHPAASGAYLIGSAGLAAVRSACAACIPDYDIYEDFALARQLYTGFRSGTGGDAAVKTAGTGNLADGWRSLNNAGTATFTLENANLYTPSPEFVGAWVQSPAGVDERFQEFNVTTAAASDSVRLRLPSSASLQSSNVFPDSPLGGDLVFFEVEVWVKSHVGLGSVVPMIQYNFASGTSPADQPYQGTTFQRALAGSVDDSGSVVFPVPDASFRAVLRTPVLRLPENINTTTVQSLDINVDMNFVGAGSATVWFARPRPWIKRAGYAG